MRTVIKNWMKTGMLSRGNCMCTDSEVETSIVYLRKRKGLCGQSFMIGQEEYKRKWEEQVVAISLRAEPCGSMSFTVGVMGSTKRIKEGWENYPIYIFKRCFWLLYREWNEGLLRWKQRLQLIIWLELYPWRCNSELKPTRQVNG